MPSAVGWSSAVLGVWAEMSVVLITRVSIGESAPGQSLPDEIDTLVVAHAVAFKFCFCDDFLKTIQLL